MMKFRLEISTANMMRCEFEDSLAAAWRRRRTLRAAGFSVTIIRIGPGGL